MMSAHSFFLSLIRLIKYLLLLLGIGFILLNTWMILQTAFSYLTPNFRSGFLSGREAYFEGLYQWGLYGHIFSSPWVICLGLIQFWERIRTKWPQVHRWTGRLYVLFILFLAAPGGLIMGIYALGGIWSQISFVLLAIIWWGSTLLAWRCARRGQWFKHKQWMIRSYVLALSAISLRLLSFLFALCGYAGTDVYIWIAWLSWLPQLLLTEIFLRQRALHQQQILVDSPASKFLR